MHNTLAIDISHVFNQKKSKNKPETVWSKAIKEPQSKIVGSANNEVRKPALRWCQITA